MKKRKTRGTKTLRKKAGRPLNRPNSDDSGVALEIAEAQKNDTEKYNLSHGDSAGIEEENSDKAINLFTKENESSENCSRKNNNSTILTESVRKRGNCFSFDDETQSCLDYEPYEDEPEDYVNSPESTLLTNCPESLAPNSPEDLQNFNNPQYPEMTYSPDFNSISTSNIQINQSRFQENSADKLETAASGKCRQRDEGDDPNENRNHVNKDNQVNMEDTYSDHEDVTMEDGYFDHEDVNMDEELEEDTSLDQDDVECQENIPDLFKNAKVNFAQNGNFNITICRPVINNSTSNSNNVIETTENATEKQVPIKKPFNRYNGENSNEKSKDQGSKWGFNLEKFKLSKITSEGNIFFYNTKYKQIFPEDVSLDQFFNTPTYRPDWSDSDNLNGCIKRKCSSAEYERASSRCSSTDTYVSNHSKISKCFNVPDTYNYYEDCVPSTSRDGLRDPQSNEGFRFGNLDHTKNGISPLFSNNETMLGMPDGTMPRNDGNNFALSPLKSPSYSEITEVYSDSQSDDREEFVSQWIIEQDITSKIFRIKTLMESLCENHFLTNCNDNARCTKNHSIVELERRIKQLPQEQYLEVYELVHNRYVWFISLFDVFTSCFEELGEPGRELLVNMITDMYDVMKLTVDKTPYVLKIIRALQKTGYSFQAAIEDIICKHGTSQIWICDILLFIISKEPNLESNWPIVKRLTFCRRDKLDAQVVTNMLNSALTDHSNNRRLVVDIFTEFYSKNLITANVKLRELKEPLRQCMTAVGIDYRHYPSLVDLVNEPPPRFSTTHRNRSDSDCTAGRRSLSTESDRQIDRGDVVLASNDPVTAYLNCVGYNSSAELGYNNSSCVQNNTENIFKRPSTLVPKRAKVQQCVEERRTCRYLDSRIVTQHRKRQNSLMPDRPERPQTPANPLAHPERQPSISKRFVCNKSLHNLYPEIQISASEISSVDLLKLKKAMEEFDAIEFLNILDTYKDSFAIENFVLNTLTFMTSGRGMSEIFNLFTKLIGAIESVEVAILKDDPVKMLIEVVAMNLVYLLEKKGEFEYCKDILRKVKDWHSSVTSKIFFCKSHLMTHMHRYIYIIQVLIRAKDYHWANEVFQTASLHLLEPMCMWPYDYVESDIIVRNETLKLFFEEAFTVNFHIAQDLFKHIAVIRRSEINGVDIWKIFDEQMFFMLKAGEKYRSSLEYLLDDVVHHYARFMNDNLLHSYYFFVRDHFKNFIKDFIEESVEDFNVYRLFHELYRICCGRGIFYNYQGTERIIKIKTSMTSAEICCILDSFFKGIQNRTVYPHDVVIELCLPQTDEHFTSIISAKIVNRSIFAVAGDVIIILQRMLNIKVEQSVQSRIFITKNMLKHLF